LTVSVIIPVRDDPDGIRQVLDCLAGQTLSKDRFEVVIGDDGSRADLIYEVTSDEDRVRVVAGPPLTSYAARNRAAAVSRGHVLAFCDADCLPDARWLEEGLAALENADVVAGEVQFQAPSRPTIWSLLTIDLFLDQKQNVSLARGVTANLLVRRDYFHELGGFDQSLPSGGDYDFVNRVVQRDGKLRYSPLATVGHPTMDRARIFLNKVFRTNYWSGFRHARDQEKMELAGILIFIPILGVMVARHRALRPVFSLYTARLQKSGIVPTMPDQFLCLAALYSIVGFVAGAARVLGRLKGMLPSKTAKGPSYPVLPYLARTKDQP